MGNKTSFEDHMAIVQGSHTKTASASKVTPSLLDKLAAEMAGGVVDAPAVTAVPANSLVTEAAPAVVAATDAIAVPQTTIAGGNEAEKEKGMLPAPSKPTPAIVISDGAGTVTDQHAFGKEPAAVAEAAEPTSKTSSDKEAEEIGRTMARSYVTEMRKIATDEQFNEAVGILKEAGLLEGYKLNVELEKEASDATPCLEKIANKQPLTKEEMVKAAHEYVELEKQAADADAYGRQQAREYFASLVKQAEDEASAADATEDEAEDEAEKKKKEEAEKTSSDKAVQSAISTLVKAGVIKG